MHVRRHRCHQDSCRRRFLTFGGLMRHVARHHPLKINVREGIPTNPPFIGYGDVPPPPEDS
jgi:hypothetical protein